MQAWMEKYKDFDDTQWNEHSVQMPARIYDSGENTDITVLDEHAWFYPMYGSESHGFYKLWFGKSFSDIDLNYGVHLWAWHGSPIPEYLDPRTVREIDTPFFCRLRRLFDNLGGDGYVAVDWITDPNCANIVMKDMQLRDDGLLANWSIEADTSDIKLQDTSGNRLHGWAPPGVTIVQSHDGRQVRQFREDSWAVHPVPLQYDGRAGTIAFNMLLENDSQQDQHNVTLARLRLDDYIDIYWRMNYDEATWAITFVVK